MGEEDAQSEDRLQIRRRLHRRAAEERPSRSAAGPQHHPEAVPSAIEVISYQMPAFKVAGGFLVYLGAWKEHYSLYPASDALVAAFKGALTPYRASKGTLRFPLSEPVPVKLMQVVDDNLRARRCYERNGFAATDRTSVRERDGAVELQMERRVLGALR